MLAKLSKSVDFVKEQLVGPKEKSISDIFFNCVQDGDMDTARRLVEEGRVGINVHNKQYYNWTALHYAAEADNANMINCLLSLGGNRSLQAQDGSTPLQWAQLRKRKKAIAALTAQSFGEAAEVPIAPTQLPSIDTALQKAACLGEQLRSVVNMESLHVATTLKAKELSSIAAEVCAKLKVPWDAPNLPSNGSMQSTDAQVRPLTTEQNKAAAREYTLGDEDDGMDDDFIELSKAGDSAHLAVCSSEKPSCDTDNCDSALLGDMIDDLNTGPGEVAQGRLSPDEESRLSLAKGPLCAVASVEGADSQQALPAAVNVSKSQSLKRPESYDEFDDFLQSLEKEPVDDL